MADSDLTNQKPDKWISNDCKAGMHTSCAALGCEDDCGHSIRTKKVIAVLDDTKPDTTLRKELDEILMDVFRLGYLMSGTSDRELNKGMKTATQSILDLLAKRLPEPVIGLDPDRSEYQAGYSAGWNNYESEVRAIIEGRDGV